MDNILEEVKAYGKAYSIVPVNLLDFIKNRPNIGKEALIINHIGMGDCINVNGAVRYILHFYNKVNMLALSRYVDNIRQLFCDVIDNINIIQCEYKDIPEIIKRFKRYDIYSLAFNYSSDTTHPFLRTKFNRKDYNKHFISMMYEFANLDMRIYSEYFRINPTSRSKELYELVKDYKITFIHESSSNHEFDLGKYLGSGNEDEMLVCVNRNLYTEGAKKELAEHFINDPIFDYYDTIINSSKIFISDSCFSSMVIPLVNKGVIQCDDITIVCRKWHENVEDLCPKVKILREE